MDAIDHQITEILVADGRASLSTIGRQVGLSANAAAARDRRLERDGVVAYRAVLVDHEPGPRKARDVPALDALLRILARDAGATQTQTRRAALRGHSPMSLRGVGSREIRGGRPG